MERRPDGTDDRSSVADDTFHRPNLVRVGGAASIAPWWAALVAGALVVLAVKPWATDEPSTPAPSGSPSAMSSSIDAPQPSERHRTPDEIVAAECLAPSGWRIFTVERWHEQTLRIWWAIAPVVADDPTDPRIPILSLVAIDVPALGYCAPLFGPDRPVPGTIVRMWRAGPGDAITEIRAPRLQPPFETPLLALYAPPGSGADRLDPTATWPTGRYLFSSSDRWFGVDLRIEPPGAPVAPAGNSQGPPRTAAPAP
jgi:hypothetical protein